MKNRIDQKELIDLGSEYYTHQEYTHWLYQMGRIGSLLGGDRATIRAFKKVGPAHNPESILDVGCGGGFFAAKLAKLYPKAQVVGIDTSQWAIEFAQNNLNAERALKHKNLSFRYLVKPELDEPAKSIDIVTATLVCHHLSDEQLITFLKSAAQIARKAIILNDLHRNWFAYYGFYVVSRFLFRNRLVWHDGPISIKRSFKRKDWENYLKKAGFNTNQYQIKWCWLFRWIVVVEYL